MELSGAVKTEALAFTSPLTKHSDRVMGDDSAVDSPDEPWVGRPPRGFHAEDGCLHVDEEVFYETREIVIGLADGKAAAQMSRETGISTRTLQVLYRERRQIYLRGETEDPHIDRALEEVRPLKQLRATATDLRERPRSVEPSSSDR